jgi:hypothetical protein
MASNHEPQRLAPPWIPPAAGRANRSQRVITVDRRRVLWTPAAITTALWLDAGDPATVISSGGLATQWNDKSGNGRNVTATGTARPTYTTGGLNNLNIMTFNGTSNFMSNTGAALLRNVSGATIMAVLRRTSNNAAEVTACVVSTSASTARARIGFRGPDPGNEGISTGGRRLAANSYQAVGTSAYTSAFTIVMAIFNYEAATLTLFENGAQTGTRVFQTAGNTENDAGALVIGANNAGTASFLNGDIAEFAIIHSAIGTTLRQRAEGYLAHRRGLNGSSLTVGHPFLVYPPYL